jgi:hypothetical protein
LYTLCNSLYGLCKGVYLFLIICLILKKISIFFNIITKKFELIYKDWLKLFVRFIWNNLNQVVHFKPIKTRIKWHVTPKLIYCHMVWFFSMFNDMMWDVIVDICRFVYHHCLNFVFTLGDFVWMRHLWCYLNLFLIICLILKKISIFFNIITKKVWINL